MAAISMLVQLVAAVCGIYLMISETFWTGAALIVFVVVMHFVFSALTNFALYIHQKTMSEDKLEGFAFMVNIGLANEAAPKSWHIITNISAVLFWLAASGVIFWFLAK